MAYSVGYFIYDLLLMFVFPTALFDFVFVVHHLIGAGAGSLTFVSTGNLD
jgi:hypothetical protein